MLEQSTKKSGSRQRPWSAGRIRGASPIAPTSVAVHFKHHRHISRPDPCSPKSTFLDREVNAIMQGQFVDDHTRSTCPACTTLNAERCSYCLRGKSSTAPRMHLHELGALLIQAAKEKKSNKKPKSTEDKRQVVSKVEALNSGRPSTPMTPKSPKQELCGPDVLTPESLLKTLVLYGRSSEFALEMNEKLNWPKRSSIAVHQQSRKWCVKHYDQYDDAAQYTAGLEKERSDNKAILKKSRKKLLEKKVEIIDALQRIQDLESLLAEEQLKTQELTKRNDSLGIYVDRASRDRSRIDQLERRNRQLTAELNDKKQQLYELEDLKEEIEGINVLHGQITTLDTENVELKSKLNATFLDLEAANQIIADAREATPRNPCRCDELHSEVESLKRRLSENICAQCGCAIDEIDKRPQNKSEAKKRPNKKMSVTAKKNHALTDGTDNQLLDQRCRSSKLLCPLGRLVPKNAEKKSAPVPPKSCQKEMYEVLEKKILADIADECADKEKKSLPEFLDDYFQSKFGLKKMADDKLKAFLQSLVRHQVDVDKAEAKGGDDGVKANRRYCFLLDALCLKNERLWSRDTSELLCLLLRRAFHSNIQSMSERLDDGPHKCFVPLDTALDMVYGDVAKRGDAGRWDNPPLWKVANAYEIEQILDDIEELEPTRMGSTVHVDLDDVIDIVMSGYYRCKARVQTAMLEAARAHDIDKNGLELEEFEVFIQGIAHKNDLTKKTLTSLWRNILQIADELKPDIPIEEQVFTNSPLFPVACMRCDIYPYVEKPKPLEKNASRFSSVVDESAAAKIKELKQKKKARNRK